MISVYLLLDAMSSRLGSDGYMSSRLVSDGYLFSRHGIFQKITARMGVLCVSEEVS